MAKPGKSKTDLFASMEDDLKQFWSALSGSLRDQGVKQFNVYLQDRADSRGQALRRRD
jgi:hypothetical protein